MNAFVTKLKKLVNKRLLAYRKSILFKILLSYIIIGATLILLLSTLLYMKFARNSMDEINNISNKSLEQSYNIMSALWGSTYAYMKKEFDNDSALATARYSEEFTPLDTWNINKGLSEIVDNNNLIYSVYVYNARSDKVFSNLGPFTDSGHFYDRGVIRDISGIHDSGNKGFVILFRKMDLTIGVTSDRRNIISVVFFDEEFKSAVIFNLDQNLLQRTIASGKPDQANQIIVVSRDGTIVAHPDTSMVFKNISQEKYFLKLNSMKQSSGYYDDMIEGKKYLVNYKIWDRLDWIFISQGDYDKLLWKVKQLQNNVILLAGLFILLCILIAAFFTGNIYMPLYKLLKSIRADNPFKELKNRNEYDYLSDIYDTLIHDIDKLKVYKNSSSEVIKKDLLKSIINGVIIRPDDLKRKITELDLKITGKRFLVAILRLDNAGEILSRYSDEDMALYRFAIGNIAEELFRDKYKVETVDSGEDNVSVIIALNDEEYGIVNGIKAILKSIQAAAGEHLHFSISAGIGSIEEGIRGIRHSYMNAMDASNYRLIYGKASIVEYKNTISAAHEDYVYPFEIEKSLMDAMKSGDEMKVESALDSFVSCISAYSYDAIMLALAQLNLISYRTAKSILDEDDPENNAILADYRHMNKMMGGFDTLEEIKGFLSGFIKKVTDAQRKKRDNKYEELIQRILKYVDDNYQDPNLTVEGLSEMVNLSPNYVRTLFKDSVGKSISSYINDMRFNKAKELLVNTDHPANKIAEMVGFPGGCYFYTAFKKAVGISPDEYRKINR